MAGKLQIEGQEISIKSVNEQDYISITDIAKKRGTQKPNEVIRTWLRNSNTIPFLEAWEKLNNPNFKDGNMDTFKIETIDNRDVITIKRYLEMTGAIGIVSTSGRYGGTFAHRQIAFEFAGWIEPIFRLYITTEFERLKQEEAKRLNQEWNTSRFLSKINYTLQTEAIQTRLIPKLKGEEKSLAYATEADLINLALFGQTAKEWRAENPEVKGNIRDGASIRELIVLSNLETHNSYLIMAGASKEARYARLCEIADSQLEIFSRDKRLNDDKRLLE
ncbi:MAG: KilA-N domain-containing protein [Bacteroidota bacterium]